MIWFGPPEANSTPFLVHPRSATDASSCQLSKLRHINNIELMHAHLKYYSPEIESRSLYTVFLTKYSVLFH